MTANVIIQRQLYWKLLYKNGDKEHLILEGEVAVFSEYVGGTCEYHRPE